MVMSNDFFIAMNKHRPSAPANGVEGWTAYISHHYGPQSCEKLLSFLSGPDSQLHALFGDDAGPTTTEADKCPTQIPRCAFILGNVESSANHNYSIDFASILPPLCLNPNPEDVILDMCSAPGGKAIVLASILSSQWAENNQSRTSLVLNESSRERFQRLNRNIREFCPADATAHLQFMNCNVLKQPHVLSRYGPYTKIMVDAPCASDRHVFKAGQMEIWRPGSSRHFVKDQIQLLTTAGDLLKLDGTLVYSTCTLSEEQNDGVIEKVLKKSKNLIKADCTRIEKLLTSYLESCLELRFQPLENYATQYSEESPDLTSQKLPPVNVYQTRAGWLVLPDVGHRSGPIYFSVLEKKPSYHLNG